MSLESAMPRPPEPVAPVDEQSTVIDPYDIDDALPPSEKGGGDADDEKELRPPESRNQGTDA
jgi:hypothetical protein